MVPCAAASNSSAFITSVISQVDCQAETLEAGSWAALASPGSTLSYVLTGFMTIFVALIGYNLLFGRNITMRSGTVAAIRVGGLLALATSWPAYNALAYNVITRGPSELLAEIGPQASIVGTDGTLTQRLDVADQALAQLAILAASSPAPAPDTQTPPEPFGGFDSLALGSSRILFELTAVAAIGGLRIITALLLALGPFFIAFLMFDTTSSIFSGWVRILAGAALAAIAASITLGLELAFLEPWLRGVLTLLGSGTAVPSAPSQLFVLTSFFTLTTLGAMWASVRIGAAFRMSSIIEWVALRSDAKESAAHAPSTIQLDGKPHFIGRERAAAVASAVVTSSRRNRSDWSAQGSLSSAAAAASSGSNDYPGQLAVPTGRVFTRSAKSRLSARAAKRDAVG